VAREELQLEASRFTNTAALAKEILHLLGEKDVQLTMKGPRVVLKLTIEELHIFGCKEIEILRLDENTLLFQRCAAEIPAISGAHFRLKRDSNSV
jgi:hypothetical protein